MDFLGFLGFNGFCGGRWFCFQFFVLQWIVAATMVVVVAVVVAAAVLVAVAGAKARQLQTHLLVFIS